MIEKICESHRKELLRFLLLKTAVVRSGVKPGELLQVKHCYKGTNAEGLQFCLYRSDILELLNLDYIELRKEENSSLILFYHRQTMMETLQSAVNLSILYRAGYPESCDSAVLLAKLKERFAVENIPHEVGVFIGYPAKDVAGFIENAPRTPVHRSNWAVFGDATESINKMNLYRQTEKKAQKALETCSDLQTFFNQMSNINL